MRIIVKLDHLEIEQAVRAWLSEQGFEVPASAKIKFELFQSSPELAINARVEVSAGHFEGPYR